MAEEKQTSNFPSSPKDILSMVELFVLVSTLVYLFAFLQADVSQNKKDIQIQRDAIERSQKTNADTYVRRDVFNEQYRQIIQRLDRLNEKLED